MDIEYNIHGWLGLRLVDPPSRLAKLVARQMDPLVPSALLTNPDVSLLPNGSPGAARASFRLGDAGDRQECSFDEADFCFLNGEGALRIPFESIGGSCEIRYAPGLNLRRMFLTYVRPILQLSLLPKGAVAVHSAAALHKGKGIVFAGWAESGKTEAMLAFLHQGASFISDKWTILGEDGSVVCNFPTPITVRGWLLDRLPELRSNLTPLERGRVRVAATAAAIADRAVRTSRVEFARRLNGLIRPWLNLGSGVSVTSSRLLSGRRDDWTSEPQPLSAPLVKVFLLMTRDEPSISVRPASSASVVRRLVDCAQYERRGLLASYTKFRYAFPDRRNPLIDDSRHLEAEMLTRALEEKEIYTVETPFPFDPLSFYDAVDPFC